MVDNFNRILAIMDIDEYPDHFMTLRIVSRNKDFDNSYNNNKLFKSYLIRSKEQLMNLKDEIVWLCENYNARAYINLSIKSFKRLQSELAMDLVKNITEGIVMNPINKINSLSATISSVVKRWIIDIDEEDMEKADDIYKLVEDLVKEVNQEKYMLVKNPSKTGLHIISSPFNTKKFSEKFKGSMIHKDAAGTLLYAK